MKVTYTKLKSGEWGVRSKGAAPLQPGVMVMVRKKSGETKQEKVKQVLWTGTEDGQTVSICAIERGGSSGARCGVGKGAPRTRRASCSCTDPSCECQRGGCRCSRMCNCRGGPVWDC